MRHDREVGKVAAWDGQSGEVARLSLTRGEDRRLTFSRADLIEGAPAVGQRCTFTPGREARALQAPSALDRTANRLIDFKKAAALTAKERRHG